MKVAISSVTKAKQGISSLGSGSKIHNLSYWNYLPYTWF